MSNVDENTKTIERTRKPVRCPTCGFRPVATILYGLPVYDFNMERKIAEGELVLGGCCQLVDAPTWQCSSCGQGIHRKRKSVNTEVGHLP